MTERYYDVIGLNKNNRAFGFFQAISTFGLLCGICGFGYIEYGLGFLLLMPQIICEKDGLT
jgi:hypothetical protein